MEVDGVSLSKAPKEVAEETNCCIKVVDISAEM
jgi:hypothetical protein